MRCVLPRDLKEKLNSNFKKNRELSGFTTELSSNASAKSREGFTLIELLVVIAIIGILVSIVVVAIDPVGIIGRSNDTKDRSDAQQIKNALQLYFNDHGDYPSASGPDEFNASCVNTCLSPDYMRSVPAGFSYALLTFGEYRVGVDLDQFTSDDTTTKTICSYLPDSAPGWWGDVDYVVCPD